MMKDALTERVKNFATQHGLLPRGARVLVAVSGGCDSTVLLHLLARLAPRLDLHLRALHVDHGLRPESAAEAERIRALTARLGLPFVSRAVQVPRGSDGEASEAAAREARRRCFVEVARESDATLVATGHTRDDQAETLLMRLGRGAGLRGLGGIAPLAPLAPGVALVRPLLDERRESLRRYARDNGLTWTEDPSNASPRYLRNRLRQVALPALAAAFERDVVDDLARLAARAREEQDELARLVAQDEGGWWRREAQDAIALEVATLASWPRALRRALLAELLRSQGLHHGLYAPHWDSLSGMCESAAGSASVDLPGGRRAERSYGSLRFLPAPLPSPVAPADFELRLDTTCGDAGLHLELRAFPRAPVHAAEQPDERWLAGGLARLPLRIRAPRRGERVPLTGGGHRRLSRLLIDRKLPRDRRAAVRLLVDDRDEALAVLVPRGIVREAAVFGPWELLRRVGQPAAEAADGLALRVRLLSLYARVGAGMVGERKSKDQERDE